MHRTSAAAALLFIALSGCSGGTDGQEASIAQAEQAASELQVEATATTGVIRGIVVDDALRPLGDVDVALSGGAKTKTSAEGAFGFDDLEPGTYFLTATLPDYTTVQQSADVVAGVSDPDIVRILLKAIPRQTPFIEAFQARMYVMGAVSTPVVIVRAGDLVGDEGSFSFQLDITPNGTVAQAEFAWEATNQLGTTLYIGGGTYNGDDDLDTSEASGPSVLMLRANATEGSETSDSVAYNMWAGNFNDPPAAYVQQHVDAFVHVFHNFRPDDGWLFTRDGEHPLPP